MTGIKISDQLKLKLLPLHSHYMFILLQAHSDLGREGESRNHRWPQLHFLGHESLAINCSQDSQVARTSRRIKSLIPPWTTIFRRHVWEPARIALLKVDTFLSTWLGAAVRGPVGSTQDLDHVVLSRDEPLEEQHSKIITI